MCVKTIVDASAFRHLCEPSEHSAGDQLRRWIVRGDGVVVYSPKHTAYADELNNYANARELLRDYNQRGLADDVDAMRIQAALDQIPDRPIRRSNDPHILALAAVTGATVLFSCDRKLRQDFANHQVLRNVGRQPRRSVPALIVESPKTPRAPPREENSLRSSNALRRNKGSVAERANGNVSGHPRGPATAAIAAETGAVTAVKLTD